MRRQKAARPMLWTLRSLGEGPTLLRAQLNRGVYKPQFRPLKSGLPSVIGSWSCKATIDDDANTVEGIAEVSTDGITWERSAWTLHVRPLEGS